VEEEVGDVGEGGKEVEIDVEGDVPSVPKGPGFRWCKGRIALNKCVIIDAPNDKAYCASSYVASVWPILKTIPLFTNSGMQEDIEANSGAAVIILIRGGMSCVS
jgi:hypothetical protein